MNITYIVIGIIVLLVVWFVAIYNSLVQLRVRIKEAMSGIDVQLKRRTNLIPNLVETVKGYAKHEKEVFKQVTEARSALVKAKTPQGKAEANTMLTGALKTLFAVAEAYPDLKANTNFVSLQKELSDTEDKVAYSRQFYNSNVLEYNTKIKVLPNVLIASQFGFTEEEFFEIEDAQDKKNVKVTF